MAPPRIGSPARGSRTGRPVMVLLDALGRRWALRVLWELAGGAATFRGLRAAVDEVAPGVLSARLGELRALGLVARGPGGYALTGDGAALVRLLQPLGRWAERWGARLSARAPASGSARAAPGSRRPTGRASGSAPAAPARRR